MIVLSPMQPECVPAPFSEDVVDQYLAVLGQARRDPCLAALRDLVAAHLTRIPFENISKLYYRKRMGLVGPPEVRLYLEGIEKYHFGGTCYSNNYYFHLLLKSLGYEAKFCSADMSAPDVHAVNVLTIDGREYLVDAGYGAPLLEPIPRDLERDFEVRLGPDRYVLKPQDANGCSRLDLYRDGVLKHGYLAKPAARNIEDFRKAIAQSFAANATFMNSVLLVRFFPRRSVVIHNLTLIESEQDSSKVSAFADSDALLAGIEKHFGIPRSVVSEAIDGLGALRDAWN